MASCSTISGGGGGDGDDDTPSDGSDPLNMNALSQGGTYQGWFGSTTCTGTAAYVTSFSAGDCINLPTGSSVRVSRSSHATMFPAEKRLSLICCSFCCSVRLITIGAI